MKSGFTYKNRHSSEFGIVAKTVARPVLPEMKSYTMEAPLADGIYDFSEANEYNRPFYNNRFFEIRLQVSADSLLALELKVSKIASWLCGSGELMFDDMPFVKWKARVISEMGFMPELHGKKAVMTVNFRVEPFSACIFNTADGPLIDCDLCLDSDIPLSIHDCLTWTFDGSDSAYTNISKPLMIVNMGNVYTRPVMRINGDAKNIIIAVGGKKLKINTQGLGFVLDFKNQTVSDINGNNVMQYVTGDFFELLPMNTELDVTMEAKGTVKLSVEYEPEFIYAYSDDTDWSESNA